jgi:predicted TPR repeat methyltransferase
MQNGGCGVEQLLSNVREIDIGEAVALAVDCQRNGRLDDAAALYREILATEPERPDALHYSGVLAHQQGRLEEATMLLQRSLAVDPGQADCFSNLAIILHARGRNDEAIAACERAIALQPEHANAHSNLGALLKAEGRLAEAEAAYRRAIDLNPDHAGAWVNLGILVSAQGRVREAVSCYCKVITLSPKHPDARRLLALAHSTLGEIDKAAAIYEAWLREEPENPIAQHMAAACTGTGVPARASDAYVAATFDGFADSFDDRLAHLQYRAPALVTQVIGEPGEAPATQFDVLDAGCGTGLCGPLVAPWARRLVGVDLSGRMLVQARERQVYDELVQVELTAYLRACRAAFDVILSADTLVYFGPLEEVVSAAAGALRPGGRLVFTAEELAGEDAAAGFALRPHGRYGHMPVYVERVLAAAGLTVEIARAELRMEGGAPVAGLVVRGTKPSNGWVNRA